MSDRGSVEGVALAKSFLPVPALLNFGSFKREGHFQWPNPGDKITISVAVFRDLLRASLSNVVVDEKFYLSMYSDVVGAIKDGSFVSPQHHYIEYGYFEDRLPFRIKVDEDYYFRMNPDIKLSVDAGRIPSAQIHFERHGYKEGRLPRDGWSLLGA